MENPRPILLAALFGLALGLQAEPRSGDSQPFEAPAIKNPMVFAWGARFAQVQSELGEARILESKVDSDLRFTKGDLEYRYAFFSRPGTMLEPGSSDDPDPRVVSGGGPANAGNGILFSVTILLPGTALHGPAGKGLVAALEDAYGKIGNRTQAFFDLENLNTSVRVYLETYRRIPYIRRVTFVSKRLALERNRIYNGAIKVGEREFASGPGELWKFSKAVRGGSTVPTRSN